MGAMAASRVMRAPAIPIMGIPGINKIITTDKAAKIAVRAIFKVLDFPAGRMELLLIYITSIFHLYNVFSIFTMRFTLKGYRLIVIGDCMEEPWPYILPLPAEPRDQYRVLASIFSSEIALEILKKLRLEGKTYQKEILDALSKHSSKSVLKYLMQLSKNGILEEGMEKKLVNGRNVWVKWYTPTFVGRWLIMLLVPRDQLPKEQIKEAIIELLSFYARSIAKLCRKYELDPKSFIELFEKAVSTTI